MVVKKKAAAKKKAAPKKAAAKTTAVKKAAPKKTAAKTTAVKKAAPAKATPQMKAIPEKQTKSQVITAIAEQTGLNRKQVGEVFGALAGLVECHMKKRGSGEFTIPEVGAKIRRIRKPATKARKGISPFTGEPTVFKAKPARNQVKVTALKGLKESVEK